MSVVQRAKRVGDRRKKDTRRTNFIKREAGQSGEKCIFCKSVYGVWLDPTQEGICDAGCVKPIIRWWQSELDMDTWHFILDCSRSFICGDSCVPSACTSSPWPRWEGATEKAPEMVPELWSVFSVTLRLLTLFREVKQNLTVTFKLQPCEPDLTTVVSPGSFWASQVAWFSSQSLDRDLVPLPLLLQHLVFSSQLCACSLFFCTKELFVCLLSASPQEISCDGKLWGSFLSEERRQGADNGDAGGHKAQRLRKRRHLALAAQGSWAAGRAAGLEWSGLMGQGNHSLENPQLLWAAEAFPEAGHCSLVVMNPGLWKLWMNFYHGGSPWVRPALTGLWRKPLVKCELGIRRGSEARSRLRKMSLPDGSSTFW